MPEQNSNFPLPTSEDELAAQLQNLGHLMREQELAEADLDPSFAIELRARLVQDPELLARPEFTRSLRQRLLSLPGVRPVRDPRQRRTLWVGWGLAAIATVASVVAVLAGILTNGSATPSFAIPNARTSDLLLSFPAPVAAYRSLDPTGSALQSRPGLPYRGHLRLSARSIPAGPQALAAYQLRGPIPMEGVAPQLGIDAPTRRLERNGTIWNVATDGGPGTGRPLHSLAVSQTTGEVIYHDRRNGKLRHAFRPLSPAQATETARGWLTLVGLPGATMPLVSTRTVPGQPRVREIVFNWSGVSSAAIPAATLWVTPARSVVEVVAWPPVHRSETVSVRSVARAWQTVQRGRVPLAVTQVNPSLSIPGSGTLTRVRPMSILTAGAHGRLYLVPAFRFEGIIHLRAIEQVKHWFGLVPAHH